MVFVSLYIDKPSLQVGAKIQNFDIEQLAKINFVTWQVFGEEASRFPKVLFRV